MKIGWTVKGKPFHRGLTIWRGMDVQIRMPSATLFSRVIDGVALQPVPIARRGHIRYCTASDISSEGVAAPCETCSKADGAAESTIGNRPDRRLVFPAQVPAQHADACTKGCELQCFLVHIGEKRRDRTPVQKRRAAFARSLEAGTNKLPPVTND